jgi:hypothetical protein
MSKNPNLELRKEWERRIAVFRASGQTQSKWCEANEISVHQLKYWLKRIDRLPFSSRIKYQMGPSSFSRLT